MTGAWGVLLNGVYLSGGTPDENLSTPACTGADYILAGCLSSPPIGIGGTPPQRTEDIQYAQRDGAKHFNDWYEPRIITLENVTVCNDNCGCGTTGNARLKKNQLVQAWGRGCCDTELVVFTDCHNPAATGCEERAVNGPFGFIGRPRVADGDWLGQGTSCWQGTLRFDCVDQEIYILDECGTPGVGECVQITPGTELTASCFDWCFTGAGWCFTDSMAVSGSVEPTDIHVCGTERTFPTITFNPGLSYPTLQNLTTEEYILFAGNVSIGEEPVVIDTRDMTAKQGDRDVTYQLRGSGSFSVVPGDYQLRLLIRGDTAAFGEDLGNAVFCWRNTVLSA